jgi:hypothetical protein
MIERLRELLKAAAPSGVEVTERRTQFAFGEDSEAYCDIAVIAPDDDFRLVVVRCYGFGDADRSMNEFFARVWLRRAKELWLVDEDAQRIMSAIAEDPDQTLRELLTDPLAPVALAPLRLERAAVIVPRK